MVGTTLDHDWNLIITRQNHAKSRKPDNQSQEWPSVLFQNLVKFKKLQKFPIKISSINKRARESLEFARSRNASFQLVAKTQHWNFETLKINNLINRNGPNQSCDSKLVLENIREGFRLVNKDSNFIRIKGLFGPHRVM